MRKVIVIPDDDLRLLTWVIMDGCLVNRKDKIHHIQFKLSKQRKINYLKTLLDKLDIPYTFQKATMSGCNKLQPYMIRIYGDYARSIDTQLNNDKQIPESFIDLTKEQFKVILSMIAITDGSRSYCKYVWTTTSQNDFEIVLSLCGIHGIKHIVYNHKLSSGFPNAKKQYKMGFYL